MTTKGRARKDDDMRAGHRAAVGQGEAIEVTPVESRLIGVEPPGGLPPLACEVWRICVTDMAKLGHLREPDLIPLRGYCVAVAVMFETEATIEEFGAMMKEPILAWSHELQANEMVGWKLKANPAVKQHREQLAAVRLVSAELALTPIARIRGNLMAAATTSLALGVVKEIDADLAAEDAAVAVVKKAEQVRKRKAAARKKAAVSKKAETEDPPAKKKPPARRAKKAAE